MTYTEDELCSKHKKLMCPKCQCSKCGIFNGAGYHRCLSIDSSEDVTHVTSQNGQLVTEPEDIWFKEQLAKCRFALLSDVLKEIEKLEEEDKPGEFGGGYYFALDTLKDKLKKYNA